MEATEREKEIASRYLTGEYTEVQFNYLLHQCGSTKERMERIIEQASFQVPLANAAKFILACLLVHFIFCLAYSFAKF